MPPGPFKEDTRILYEKDYDDIRTMFKRAHKLKLIKRRNYKLIQMVQEMLSHLFQANGMIPTRMDLEIIGQMSHGTNLV